jgi:hypothetical protein
MGLVNTNPLAMLSRRIAEHKLPADQFLTHEFSFDQMLEAYDVFDGADTYEALKCSTSGHRVSGNGQILKLTVSNAARHSLIVTTGRRNILKRESAVDPLRTGWMIRVPRRTPPWAVRLPRFSRNTVTIYWEHRGSNRSRRVSSSFE